jgi:hypothetical protein
MVRKGGLEPPCLTAPPPQDGVSANSTTSALESISYIPFSKYKNVCQVSRSKRLGYRHLTERAITFEPHCTHFCTPFLHQYGAR